MEIVYLYKQGGFAKLLPLMQFSSSLVRTLPFQSTRIWWYVDIVTQIIEAIKEANECIKKTHTPGICIFDTVMESDNRHSYGKTASDTFLDEENERSKRRLNVILHNVEKSSADEEVICR